MASTTGPVTVTALAGNEMHCRSLIGVEELGRMFEYNLELLCLNHEIALSDALGQNLTVSLELASGLRHFNGYVSRFSFVGVSGRYAVYRASLHPWLWFLTTKADCRIYPQRTIPDIVKRIFGRYHQAVFRGDVAEDKVRDHTVQYRETDFNFISRLLEETGIYYYFEHEEAKHTLVFADSLGAHDPVEGDTIPYHPPTDSGRRFEDHIDGWRVSQEIQTGDYAMKDYDFVVPKGDLTAIAKPVSKQPRIVSGEIFDYPGGYSLQPYGETLAAARINELHTHYETVEAHGSTRALGVGQLFTLTDFPRTDQNREYLVVRARYEIHTHDLDSGESADNEVFRASYALVDSQQAFRPARSTPRPIMQGPQTAVVVGDKKTKNDGTEIWTDEHARVKVRFFWERLGSERHEEKDDQDAVDEDKTCWVRVSQLWAGSGWGGLHVPRIGQEVIVDFLEGDPDRPIITGRVYNGDNKPPYLDAKSPSELATQSGIKSRSTPKGTLNNYNEIKFEDKKGKEELHIQAERDQSTHVKRNQSISVDGDRSVSVGGNESITITKKETQTYKDDRMMTVTGTNTDEVHKLHKGTYLLGRTEVVSGAEDKLTVSGQDKTVTVSNNYMVSAALQYQVMQGANSITIKDMVTIANAGKCTVTLQGGKATIEAPSEIAFTCGGSSVVLASDGTISITGTTINISAKTSKIGNANNNAAFEPAGTTLNGVKITSAATGVHEINGAVVKIG